MELPRTTPSLPNLPIPVMTGKTAPTATRSYWLRKLMTIEPLWLSSDSPTKVDCITPFSPLTQFWIQDSGEHLIHKTWNHIQDPNNKGVLEMCLLGFDLCSTYGTVDRCWNRSWRRLFIKYIPHITGLSREMNETVFIKYLTWYPATNSFPVNVSFRSLCQSFGASWPCDST